MAMPHIAVWFENGQYYYPESLSDLAQQIHKMSVSLEDLKSREYRLKNRITTVYREGSGNPMEDDDPIFELDSMKLDNYASTENAFLRVSDDGTWELRDENNDLVPLEAIDEAKELINFFKNENRFRKIFPKAGL